MPGGDRTGPMGMGPKTGRGAGYCAGFQTAGYANPLPGSGFAHRGRGAGRGFGRGMGYRWMSPYGAGAGIPAQDEAGLLKARASFMQKELESINARINELESGPAQSDK